MILQKQYLSIDIGGTNIKYALLDRAGNIIEKNKIVTPTTGISEFTAGIKEIIDQYRKVVRGIAFSVPGTVDVRTGAVYHGGSLAFLDKANFKQLFGEEYGLPVAVENDGKAAALAELWLGNLNGINSGAAIVLGTGVGGGIVLDGKLYYGEHLQAGEFSFILNNYATSDYMAAAVGTNLSAVKMIKTIGEKLQLENPVDGQLVFEYINQRDKRVWPIFEVYCQYIAKLILSLQAILDVDQYVIGGGISAQSIVTDTVNQQLGQMLDANPLVRNTLSHMKVLQARFGNDANLFGALYSFLLQTDEGSLIL